MQTEEKKKELDLAIAQIERQYGKGSIMKMDQGLGGFPACSSGIIGLDIALGIGGFPKGRISEIYGPESSGKTTIALHVVAEVQRQGGVAAFIDAEHALDIQNAKRLGVNIDDLLVAQPDYGEQALEIADTLVRSNAVDIVVVDSVAALVPKSELEGDMGDSHMGLQARLMSQALRKLTGSVAKSNSIFIFINQLRMKIGVMFGNPETTTGGNALKFYSSIRIDVRKTTVTKRGEVAIGHRVKIKIVKNKVAPPFQEHEVELVYGRGLSRISSLLECGVNDNIIQKSGTWYSYGPERIGQGQEKAELYLEEHPELAKEIDQKLREFHHLPPVVMTAAPAGEGDEDATKRKNVVPKKSNPK